MKYLTILFALSFLLTAIDETYAQPLSVSVEQPANGNRLFATPQGKFSVSGTTVRFGEREISDQSVWSLSAASNRFTYLDPTGGEVKVNQFSNSRYHLYSETLPFFNPDDSTLKLYTFTDGRTVIRDNVANFSFLNPAGQQLFSISNSSGSQSGERPSELAADPAGVTIVLYNPAISFGETTGSRAVLVYGENDTKLLFSSENQEITDLQVTPDGKYILLVAQDGSSSEIYFSDRFGNILFTLPSYTIQGERKCCNISCKWIAFLKQNISLKSLKNRQERICNLSFGLYDVPHRKSIKILQSYQCFIRCFPNFRHSM